ncbi:MAG: hypothetical protein HYZ58_04805 [Acidobacteria bacterium]|nr:hypothetical protein [Acidobacteriota bacterium]
MARRATAPMMCKSVRSASGAEASGRSGAAAAVSSVTRSTSNGSVITSSRVASTPVT